MGESGAAPIASWRAPFYKRGSGPESAKNKLAPTWKSVLHCSRRRNLPVLVSFQCSLREVGEQLRAARALGTSSSCFAAVAGGGWLVIAVVLLSLPFRNSQATSHSMTTPRHHAALIIWMHKDVETVEYVWCDRATHRGLSSVCSRLADGGRTLLLLATAAPELSSLSAALTAGEEAREAQTHLRVRPNVPRYSQ